MRFLDVIFFLYFLLHIPIAIVIDTQGLIPSKYFPQQLVALKNWYCTEFRDPMFGGLPAWYKSLFICEIFQFPFFFVAAYGFFQGAQKCKWLRLPCIICGCNMATLYLPSISHILLHDFSQEKLPSPRSFDERLYLLSAYSPFFLLPVALVLDALFSSAYRGSSQEQRQQQQQQQKQKKIK